jgi:hypothetical protein
LPFGMPQNINIFHCFFKRRNHVQSDIADTIRKPEPEDALQFHANYEMHLAPRAASVSAYLLLTPAR